MTPHEFIAKWRAVALKERSAAQSHFNDLCALLGLDDPTSADPTGEWFTFERGASKTTGGEGWADVWRKEHFAWEYKGRHANLDAALKQLLNYQHALDNPPLLIVSDMDLIRIHTNWTNSVHEVHTLSLDDLADAGRRDLLRACFTEPERLKPGKTRQMLTEEAADRFVALAQRLRDRGHPALEVAHFVNRLVFCMFAEDVGLLPDKLFQRLITSARKAPDKTAARLADLFATMRDGGEFGADSLAWFNGGLFDSDLALPLTFDDLKDLTQASALDWSEIDPSIMGTLFERGLDPGKRSQLGAHYTDRDKIMMIVEPVIVRPLLDEWDAVKARMQAVLDAAPKQTKERLLSSSDKAKVTKAVTEATTLYDGFLDRLKAFRVLDPACGSGNFLYLALHALRDIEHRAGLDAEALGLPRSRLVRTGPENMLGIEINPFAAELARVSVWIGDIQWSRKNGLEPEKSPVLRPLQNIECRDAVLNPDGTRAEWPKADVVVGNPPFLGASRMIGEFGKEYVDDLRSAWSESVPGFADLVCFWFAKAWEQIQTKGLNRAGLVSTNSIRGGANREVLKRIVEGGRIFEAWSDEEWTVDGAAVRVSLICFTKARGASRLDGREVAKIHADVTGQTVDLIRASRLSENGRRCFEGFKKYGPFDVDGNTARSWLDAPLNPNGKKNNEVLFPYLNSRDLMSRQSDQWVIDFHGLTEAEASLFERPFQHAFALVAPYRSTVSREHRRLNWWLYGETNEGLRRSIRGLNRILLTSVVAKHRTWRWSHPNCRPSNLLFVVPRDDDTTFGILHSRFHELWSLRMGTWLGVGNDPRYTPSTTFETFPFPEGLTPDIPASAYADDPRAQAIAVAAAKLNELREAWLNPLDLVNRVPEVVPGYPDRVLPKDDAAAEVLKKRTLTNLYNARPAWLDDAHRALDRAVAAAYGWPGEPAELADDEILARLFRLNRTRAEGG